MEKKWWKESVVYQIYPKSFQDSNGDGIGDIPGIISRLDYLAELGADVLWLCPVYSSPNDDNGYDVSNYRDIMPEFGTLADIDLLIKKAHEKGLKIVMDLIVNHTSDENPWFIEARKSKDNPYHDYYIWKDGEKGVLPNNWESHFSGPAWEYVDELGQYYLHIFSKKQPDLNWENEKVRKEVVEICRFWLERGIDGFRMDTINFISKVPGFPSVPGKSGLVRGHDFYMNGPKVHEYLHGLYESVLKDYDIMTVGETPNVTPQIALQYVGEDRGELNMIFQFEHMLVDSYDGGKWNLIPMDLFRLKEIMSKWQKEMDGGWNSLFLNNHDQPRMVSRFGDDGKFRRESACMLATMLHTLKGTPYIYQGEELGMTNIALDSIDQYQDIQTINFYHDQLEKGIDPEKIMAKIHYRSRDNARTPMQWSDEENAGFSSVTPWFGVNPNYKTINARQQMNDSNSIFHYYQKLIALRKKNPVVVYGDYKEYFEDSHQLYAYSRTLDDTCLFVLLNLTGSDADAAIPESLQLEDPSVYISNYGRETFTRSLKLAPYEAYVVIGKIRS